jgi:release factor glutamine methyltransferase
VADEPLTLQAAVAAARRRLCDAGIPLEDAALDARLLAQHVLGWDTARFLTWETSRLPDGFADQFELLVERRARREPLAYITGTREFWGLPFEVSPAVLIPRPETELLVEAALERFANAHEAIRIADVCTGSGCIAAALARERPAARVTATDVSAAALEVAQRNIDRLQVADRIELVLADLLAGVSGPFDLIVSNPPYVPATARPSLQPEVRDHEPGIALFGGEDGLAIVAKLAAAAADQLRPGGVLMFEFGAGQQLDIDRLIAATQGLRLSEVKHDLQGIPRSAIAIRT